MIHNINIQKHEIKPTGKILDIASGHHPFVREGLDVTYIDKYPDKNVSRKSNLVQPGKEVMEMDVEAMSFEDGEFSYVLAGDILEHCNDPITACEEIMRVGRAGWVRCPTMLWECLFGREYHFWTTNLIDDTLVFYPIRLYFKRCDYKNGKSTRLLEPESLHCSFEWEDSFKYKVLRMII